MEEIKIGNQVWMKKNMDVGKFRNGEPIPHAKTEKEWLQAVDNDQPAWCFYNNEDINGEEYGKLYNCYAVNDPRGLAPEGWHVPSNEEWEELIECIGGFDMSGFNLKSRTGWFLGGNGNDKFGFSGLPCGFLHSNYQFYGVSESCWWWSSSEGNLINVNFPHCYYLVYERNNISRGLVSKDIGLSIRCIKDKVINKNRLVLIVKNECITEGDIESMSTADFKYRLPDITDAKDLKEIHSITNNSEIKYIIEDLLGSGFGT